MDLLVSCSASHKLTIHITVCEYLPLFHALYELAFPVEQVKEECVVLIN